MTHLPAVVPAAGAASSDGQTVRVPDPTDPTAARTTLYRGGSVYSPADPFATAMVVAGDTIAWVGSDEAARAQAGDVDEVVELEGALVTPAFVDGHVHITDTGVALTGVPLSEARTLLEALEMVERASRAGAGRPVIGHGWDETTWPEGRPPTRSELDRASHGGVVYLSRIDVHSAVVSSALAQACGLRDHDGWDDSGRVEREAHGWSATRHGPTWTQGCGVSCRPSRCERRPRPASRPCTRWPRRTSSLALTRRHSPIWPPTRWCPTC